MQACCWSCQCATSTNLFGGTLVPRRPRKLAHQPSVCSVEVLPSNAPGQRGSRVRRQQEGSASHPQWQSTTAAISLAGLLAITASTTIVCPAAYAGIQPVLTPDLPVLDGARILGAEQSQALSRELTSFEQRTGWRVRVFTSFGPDGRPSDDQLREVWRPDTRTVILNFDPGNPNLTKLVHLGDSVLGKLRRPFWAELQSRFGNLFYIREQGERAAVAATMDALMLCLDRPQGCQVVPGLADDMLTATLALSAAGGLVAGSVTLLPPQGFVTSRWAWLIVFSPLWASLFINLGLGPVVSRTEEIAPLLENCAVFLAAAASPYIIKAVLRQPEPDAS